MYYSVNWFQVFQFWENPLSNELKVNSDVVFPFFKSIFDHSWWFFKVKCTSKVSWNFENSSTMDKNLPKFTFKPFFGYTRTENNRIVKSSCFFFRNQFPKCSKHNCFCTFLNIFLVHWMILLTASHVIMSYICKGR